MHLVKVTKVRPLHDYKLDLCFSDGTHGVAEIEADLTGPLAPLRALDLWNAAYVHRGVVTWSDELDLAPEFLYARAHSLQPPKSAQDVESNQLAVTMRELRLMAGKSQVEVAEVMGVAQAEVSRLENRLDTKLSTLERYVHALGGEIEIVARFGDRAMTLRLG